MISRVFISQICLSWFLIFTTMNYLYGMEEEVAKPVPSFYTKQDLEFIDSVFQKIMSMVVNLEMKKIVVWDDESQERKEILDLSDFPEDIRIFFSPPGKKVSVKLDRYLARFLKYCPQSPSCYLVALTYITRLIEKYGPNIFNQFTCYRIFLAAFVVAVKCFDDVYYPNNFYAEVGGVEEQHLNKWEVPHLNKLEVQFLQIIDFEIFVSNKEFEHGKLELEIADFVRRLIAYSICRKSLPPTGI